MLNTRQIGAYISKLRKEKDLTQGELAEALNVSHQAVSKWERGESLPDIETLDLLARYFSTTIDQILSPSSSNNKRHVTNFVREVEVNNFRGAAEPINSGSLDPETFTEITPLMKASTLKNVSENIAGHPFSLNQIIRMAPFLDSDTLSGLIAVKEEKIDTETVISLAPFINSPLLMDLLEQMPKENLTLHQVCELAPFADSLDEIIMKLDLEVPPIFEEIESLAPFINSATTSKLLTAVDEPLTPEFLARLAPFLGPSLNKWLEQVEPYELNGELLIEIAPFANRSTLSRLLQSASVDEQTLVRIAPFIERQILEQYLQKIENLSPETISEVSHFINRDTLKSLIRAINDR